MKLPSPIAILCALASLAPSGAAFAAPGERTDGQRLLGVCQTLLGEESSFCDVITDWSVDKVVDLSLADQPNRQGLAYTIRLIEGQTRYVLGMTSIVTLVGLIPEGTEVRGIVVSLQRATPVAAPAEPLYTTVAGALVGDADPLCGCPYVASGGELTVTLRDQQGNSIPPSAGSLIESLEYSERMVVQLDAIYDLSAGIVLPGELVRIQACVQYAPSDEADVPGCFDEGGAVRSVRACSGFDFEAYAQPKNAQVTLEEALQVPSRPWILPNGFKARSGSALVTPAATLMPVVPGAEPVVFQVAASGQPNTETVISVKGDVSCADVVECGGPNVCSGNVTNTATLDFGDARGRVSASATTEVLCAAHRCNPAESAGCDDGDPCTIDRCDVGIGCVHTAWEGACDDGDACTLGETCVAGECQAGETISCADDDNPCTEETCDEVLGCVRTSLADRSRCQDGDPCTIDDLCIEGRCEAGADVSCDDGNDCTVDSCGDDGACVNEPLTGGAGSCEDGSACTVGDHCDAGVCMSGVGPICQDDGNPCTIETCQPGLGCATIVAPNLEDCEDGDACTQGDVCLGGVCMAGGAAACDDRNPCTADGCDSELGCFNAPRAGACDDGSACTTTSSCQDGVCRGGPVRDCDDGNPCTIDSCDVALGCRHEDVGGGACDDEDPCTTGETCQSGVCLATQLTQCDDDNPCTSSTCVPGQGCAHVPSSGGCEDGDQCTGPDRCNSGVCVSGGAVSCDDKNPCTNDSCNAALGCRHVATSGACDDGDLCTGAGVCQSGTCRPGAPVSCDDQNPCTSGQCDAVQGCVQIPIGGSCDDGDACTGAGSCLLGSCAAGPAITCDDHNPCTADFCKVGVGCAALPRSDVPCDDEDPCTTNDTCQLGSCVGGAPRDCDDDNPCTADSCDAQGCQNKPVSGGCSDGSLCTLGDSCVDGECRGGAPKDCDDDDSCSADSCVAATGQCVNTRLATGAVCDDGDACSGCAWPEPLVVRGFHALDAKPDQTLFPSAVTATLELDQFAGPAAGKAWFQGQSDLRWLVLPGGAGVLRGTLSLPSTGEQWMISLAFTFRGLGRAGQGATPYYELPAGMQGAVWNDGWEYWALGSGASLVRTQPGSDSATLMPDPGLQSLPLQLGLRANGRNLGLGAALPLKWVRGTRQGTGVLRLNLEREHCQAADTCGASECEAGTVASVCRELEVGDYCTYLDDDFGAACQAGATQSAGCILASGFQAIAVERTACSPSVGGVALGHSGYRRWGFSSAQKIEAFLPATASTSVDSDQCNPGPAAARPEVGRVMALALALALSDAGVLPAPGGVPLGELMRSTGSCAGLSLREIARRAEAVVANAPPGAATCADAATLDVEVTNIINGFRNCQGVAAGVVLPE